MADRHKIVVRVKHGKVSEVQFCDCCPGITLEVRTYTNSKRAAAAALPERYTEGGSTRQSPFKRDEIGVYKASYYEPDFEDE